MNVERDDGFGLPVVKSDQTIFPIDRGREIVEPWGSFRVNKLAIAIKKRKLPVVLKCAILYDAHLMYIGWPQRLYGIDCNS